MTFLFKRNSGIYYFRKTYVLPDGSRQQVRQSLKTSDYKLAQFLALKLYFNIPSHRDLLAVVSDKKTGEQLFAISAPKIETPKFTVSKAVDQFLSEKLRTGYWTDREYRRGANMLEALAKLLGALDVSAISRKETTQFKEELLKTSKSVTTINNYLKRSAMLWDWLVDRGEVSDNPFRGTGVKQRRVVASLRDDWTAKEKIIFQKFALTQTEWRKWILLVLRYTGARPSEICQLYRSDIDFKNSTISIQALQPDQRLKTASSARTIPIHSKLLVDGFKTFVEGVNHERLFPQLNRTKDNYSQTFTTWYSKQKADVPLPGLYGARHTAATEMKNAGVPNQYASAVLGHSNSSITYDRYGKSVELQRLREAIEVIGS